MGGTAADLRSLNTYNKLGKPAELPWKYGPFPFLGWHNKRQAVPTDMGTGTHQEGQKKCTKKYLGIETNITD